VDNEKLKYKYLNQFDKDMIHMIRDNKILQSLRGNQLNMDDYNKTLIYERNNLIFALNFHPDHSVPDYRFHAPESGQYKIILCSDEGKYGGFDRVDTQMTYSTFEMDNDNKLSIYLPNRSGIVLKRIN
jgi:1,4-alpha-glucan branching enzyme